MKLNVDQFRDWENKCITLLGMSGVGKTRLANLLMNQNWFHFSGDYRIGTRYLDEAILDRMCLDNLARFKRPRCYRFVDDLPKNNYGKVLKTTLREMLAREGGA